MRMCVPADPRRESARTIVAAHEIDSYKLSSVAVLCATCSCMRTHCKAVMRDGCDDKLHASCREQLFEVAAAEYSRHVPSAGLHSHGKVGTIQAWRQDSCVLLLDFYYLQTPSSRRRPRARESYIAQGQRCATRSTLRSERKLLRRWNPHR